MELSRQSPRGTHFERAVADPHGHFLQKDFVDDFGNCSPNIVKTSTFPKGAWRSRFSLFFCFANLRNVSTFEKVTLGKCGIHGRRPGPRPALFACQNPETVLQTDRSAPNRWNCRGNRRAGPILSEQLQPKPPISRMPAGVYSASRK